MAKNISLSSVVILVLVALVIGFLLGIMIRKNPPAVSCPISYLDSKIAAGWGGYAIGDLKEISGKDFTLSSEGEALKITILEGARTRALDNGKLVDAKFEDIKVGDKIEIKFAFSDKKMLGSVVTILPKQ